MLLLLVRHAVAEERGMKPDFLRALTEEGRGKIEKAYPLLCNALKEYSVRLVSSPLVRAWQTAEVLERYLDTKMELQDWVAMGDTHSLVRTMSETEEDILIVVGHEPTLSGWCERFGFPVGWMKKGSAAFFEFGAEAKFIGYLKVKDMMADENPVFLQALQK